MLLPGCLHAVNNEKRRYLAREAKYCAAFGRLITLLAEAPDCHSRVI
jgi:hypothetical protein